MAGGSVRFSWGLAGGVGFGLGGIISTAGNGCGSILGGVISSTMIGAAANSAERAGS
jgi:hypothetical protein